MVRLLSICSNPSRQCKFHAGLAGLQLRETLEYRFPAAVSKRLIIRVRGRGVGTIFIVLARAPEQRASEVILELVS